MKSIIIGITILFGVIVADAQLQQAETRGKIVVIDTGIHKTQLEQKYMCRDGFTGNAYIRSTIPGTLAYNTGDVSIGNRYTNHGHNVIWLIGSQIDVKKYCIVSIKAFDKNKSKIKHYHAALRAASLIPGVVAVNLSISSDYEPGVNPYSVKEHAHLTKLVISGIKVNVASGNYAKTKTGKILYATFSKRVCNVFPACLKNYYDTLGYKNFKVIRGKDTPTYKYSHNSSSFILEDEDGYEIGNPKMTGSSQATANFTGKEFSK